MKKVITIILSIALFAASLTGCTDIRSASAAQKPKPLPVPVQGAPTNTLPSQGITVNQIKFEKIDPSTLSSQYSEVVNGLINNKGYHYWQEDGNFYIAIFAGAQPTAGYEINVKSIEDNEGKTNIQVEISKPSGMAAQVVTYPFVIIKTTGITDNFDIRDLNEEVFTQLTIGC